MGGAGAPEGCGTSCRGTHCPPASANCCTTCCCGGVAHCPGGGGALPAGEEKNRERARRSREVRCARACKGTWAQRCDAARGVCYAERHAGCDMTIDCADDRLRISAWTSTWRRGARDNQHRAWAVHRIRSGDLLSPRSPNLCVHRVAWWCVHAGAAACYLRQGAVHPQLDCLPCVNLHLPAVALPPTPAYPTASGPAGLCGHQRTHHPLARPYPKDGAHRQVRTHDAAAVQGVKHHLRGHARVRAGSGRAVLLD